MKIPATPAVAILAVLFSGTLARAQPAPTTTKPVEQIQLKPTSRTPINLHITDQSKAIYQTIGKLEGLNVLFDSDYQSKSIQVDLTDTSLNDALHIVGELSGTYYRPVTPDTIFVAANTHAKHNDFDPLQTHTIYLRNASQQADANDIITAVRNILTPESKILLVSSENAIVMRTTPEMLQMAQALVNDLDLPKKTYRLVYTVTDVDGNKPGTAEHYSMLMVSGQNAKLKQGSKVPIITGSYNPTATTGDHPIPAGVQTQVTYLDVGMNFDATLQASGNGAILKSSVERSATASEQSGVGPQDPIVRQTSLSGVFYLTPGKPIMLGSAEVTGTTHHIDIEVELQPLP
jgi:hypothetical protein